MDPFQYVIQSVSNWTAMDFFVPLSKWNDAMDILKHEFTIYWESYLVWWMLYSLQAKNINCKWIVSHDSCSSFIVNLPTVCIVFDPCLYKPKWKFTSCILYSSSQLHHIHCAEAQSLNRIKNHWFWFNQTESTFQSLLIQFFLLWCKSYTLLIIHEGVCI